VSSNQLVTEYTVDLNAIRRGEIRRSVVIDGITYQLTAHQLACGWLGIWSCAACSESGTHHALRENHMAALEFAEKDLNRHHRQVHRRPTNTHPNLN
jgi:hypothetical protein